MTGTDQSKGVPDPHPSTEEDYDKIPHPGGARPPKETDPGPNTYTNDGTKLTPPDNKGRR
jgi:hypothetical protein